MKYIIKAVSLILMLVLLSAVMFGCGKNDEDNEPEEKPDLHRAMLEYEEKTQKKSMFEGEFKVTFFQKSGGEVKPQSIAQKLVAERIQNEDQIYIDAKLGTSFISEGFMGYLEAIISILNSASDEEMSVDQEILKYLNGETEFRGLLGYDGLGTYNVKGDYNETGQTPDYKDDMGNPYWFSVDEVSVINLMHNMNISGSFSLKDYLMFSTMIDLSPSEEWVRRDEEEEFFSEDEEAYMYAITTYGAKLRALIADMIGEAEENLDSDEYAEELQLYADIFPTVMSWLSVHDSKVDAKVDKDGNMRSFASSITVDLNINIEELRDILELLIEDDPDITPSTIRMAMLGMSLILTSATGSNDVWTIRFELATQENFYYDENSIDLSEKDQELFIPNSEDVEGRTEIRIEANEN
ncbi:MAG: hypothetical protein ACOCWI_02540 [Bacillota bacterium]